MLGRLKNLWWALGVLGFLCGLAVSTIVKFNVYYLDEQSSAATLQAVAAASALAVNHFSSIDAALREQDYVDKKIFDQIKELGDHVHALDARADRDRDKITESLAAQDKNNQAILLLLQPPVRRR